MCLKKYLFVVFIISVLSCQSNHISNGKTSSVEMNELGIDDPKVDEYYSLGKYSNKYTFHPVESILADKENIRKSRIHNLYNFLNKNYVGLNHVGSLTIDHISFDDDRVLVAYGSGALYSEDFGETWKYFDITKIVGAHRTVDIREAYIDKDIMALGSNFYGLFVSYDRGHTWYNYQTGNGFSILEKEGRSHTYHQENNWSDNVNNILVDNNFLYATFLSAGFIKINLKTKIGEFTSADKGNIVSKPYNYYANHGLEAMISYKRGFEIKLNDDGEWQHFGKENSLFGDDIQDIRYDGINIIVSSSNGVFHSTDGINWNAILSNSHQTYSIRDFNWPYIEIYSQARGFDSQTMSKPSEIKDKKWVKNGSWLDGRYNYHISLDGGKVWETNKGFSEDSLYDISRKVFNFITFDGTAVVIDGDDDILISDDRESCKLEEVDTFESGIPLNPICITTESFDFLFAQNRRDFTTYYYRTKNKGSWNKVVGNLSSSHMDYLIETDSYIFVDGDRYLDIFYKSENQWKRCSFEDVDKKYKVVEYGDSVIINGNGLYTIDFEKNELVVFSEFDKLSLPSMVSYNNFSSNNRNIAFARSKINISTKISSDYYVIEMSDNKNYLHEYSFGDTNIYDFIEEDIRGNTKLLDFNYYHDILLLSYIDKSGTFEDYETGILQSNDFGKTWSPFITMFWDGEDAIHLDVDGNIIVIYKVDNLVGDHSFYISNDGQTFTEFSIDGDLSDNEPESISLDDGNLWVSFSDKAILYKLDYSLFFK